MNYQPNAVISRRPCCALALWSMLFALTLQVLAHGGFVHVIGTVTKIENDTVIVKTAKGEVAVKLNDKTEITKNDQKAAVADVKPGVRVVVDVPEGSKEMLAHSVKVGVSGVAGAHPHDEHN